MLSETDKKSQQDARDRLAEQTALMLIGFLRANCSGDMLELRKAENAIEDLRNYRRKDLE